MTVSKHISQEDLISYALQGGAEHETAETRSHLSECASCSAELARISGDLALIAMSVAPNQLPEGARQRFLDRIQTAPSHQQKTLSMPSPPKTGSGSKRGSATAWIAWGAAAAMFVITAGLGLKLHQVNLELKRQLTLASEQSAENARARRVLEVLTTPGAQRVMLAAAGTRPAPSARAIYLSSRGELILQASNLNPLENGKTYELWIIPATGAAPIPAGLFRPDTSGSANVVLPLIPEGVQAKAFGVTIENERGSPTPTLPIILSGAAPSGAGE